MVSRNIARTSAFVALALMPSIALAHTGIGATSGMAHGFSHPISGLDHMLAMVMVGVFAFQIGGRALWLLPAAFLCLMAVGGAIGFAGIFMPFVEIGIAASVLALGAAVTFKIRAPMAIALGIVSIFALFHGHAHGTEMPENMGGIAYATGFMLATVLLHAAGVAAGFLLTRMSERRGGFALQTTGAVAFFAGLGLLTGLI